MKIERDLNAGERNAKGHKEYSHVPSL